VAAFLTLLAASFIGCGDAGDFDKMQAPFEAGQRERKARNPPMRLQFPSGANLQRDLN